jgi:DNA-binding CsgD family transcriptional regulator
MAISSPQLVGREREIETLSSALKAAEQGRPSLTLLIGEAGVGKTRLVRETETIARDRGMLVMSGDCLELSGGELPYTPIAAALREVPESVMDPAIAALPPQARDELAHAFPDVIGATGIDVPRDDQFGQSRLFGWLLVLLRALTETTAVLLIIEDLQWADTSSRDFLRFLVQSLRSAPFAAVATVRSDERSRASVVRRFVAQLERSERVRSIDVGPLTEEAVEHQVTGILGGEPPSGLVHRLFARSQGNPFFVEELLAADAGDAEELPEKLQDALLPRTEALPADARELLRLIAVAARPVDDTLIRLAGGLPAPGIDRALRECVDENVLVCDRRTGQYAVRHALVREAIYGDLLPAERSRMHGRIAEALERSDGAETAAERARHWSLARDSSRALLASIEAGLTAERIFGYGEALAHFERAIELWRREPPAPSSAALDLVSLLARAAQAARWMGDSARARELCQRALDAFDHASDPRRAARLYERLGRYQPWNVEASLEAYTCALELLPDDCAAERMRLHVDEALAHSYRGRWEDARYKATIAIGLAQGEETLAIESSALAVRGVAVAFLGHPDEGERDLREGLELARRADSAEDLAQIHLDLGEVLRLQGRIEEALATMLAGEQVADAAGAYDSYGNFMAVNAADDLLRLGRWAELSDRLRELKARQLEQTQELLMVSVAGRLDVAQGRFDLAAAHFDRAVELCEALSLVEFVPQVYAGYAELELWRKKPLQARERISEGLRKLGDGENVLHVPVLHSCGARVEAEVAEVARLGRDHSGATGAEQRAREHHEHLVTLLAGHSERATAPEAQAHLASCAAEVSRAMQHPSPDAWEKAVSCWQGQGAPHQLAYASFRLAEAVVHARGPRGQAQRALSDAFALSESLGAAPLEAEIRRVARRTRLHLTTAAQAAPATAPEQADAAPFDLTSRELDVLRLLGAGLTNREISARLYISQHTAGVHVSHILAKLQVPNRAMAAAVAERLGLVPHD